MARSIRPHRVQVARRETWPMATCSGLTSMVADFRWPRFRPKVTTFHEQRARVAGVNPPCLTIASSAGDCATPVKTTGVGAGPWRLGRAGDGEVEQLAEASADPGVAHDSEALER